VAFSQKGDILVSAGYDTIKLWDVDQGIMIFQLSSEKSDVLSVVFSPNGKRIAAGYLDGSVSIWGIP